MGALADRRTLGAVVLHQPGRPVRELRAVRDLAPQVAELLLVHNGPGKEPDDVAGHSISFVVNRGTAAAWNAALSYALGHGHRYLFLLDQDSEPSPTAVEAALAHLAERPDAAAVVQPPSASRLPLDPFPWNTVASGSLLDAEAVADVGGFDERLFVDEVDHELFARLLAAGRAVVPLARPTVDQRVGRPRPVRIGTTTATVTGHGPARRRLQGYSGGLLVRRYSGRAPATSGRLLLRHALTAAKDLWAGEQDSARALASGFGWGVTTANPPRHAAERACPYCEGPLLGRFAAVEDWIFGTGRPADVYRCAECGALAAGRTPDPEELASWYADYYTHTVEPSRTRVWSRLWPTPRRRSELERMHWYFTAPRPPGRFLEVGTGSGERLVQFADAGWEVVGQDIDAQAGHVARARGIEVHHCPVAELVGREAPFDLIGLNHVVEHVPDPAELLEACAALLAPSGRICVVSPNADALGRLLFGRWWYGLDQPRHLAIPTLESLARLTSRVGLHAAFVATVPTNAAVVLGSSLSRWFEERLPPGFRRGARFAMAFAGQTLGRAAVRVDDGLGEEVVWVGGRTPVSTPLSAAVGGRPRPAPRTGSGPHADQPARATGRPPATTASPPPSRSSDGGPG